MLKQLCIVAVTVMLCITLGEVAYTVHYARGRTVYTFDQTNKVLRETSQTLDEFRKGVTKWSAASDQQVKATSQALSAVSAVAGQTTTLLSRTDNSLNSLLTPQILSALNEQNSALLSDHQQLQANLSELRSATDSLKQTLSDVDKQVSSPQISNSLSNIEASTLNLNAGIKNLTGVTADAKEAADYEVAQLKKPLAVWKQVLQFVLSYGSDARVLFTGGR